MDCIEFFLFVELDLVIFIQGVCMFKMVPLRSLKHGLLVFKNQFVSVFSISFFYSLLTSFCMVALCWVPWSIEELFSINPQESLQLVLQQQAFFPITSTWQFIILKLTACSPWLVISLYGLIILFLTLITIGFTKTLFMIYDNKKVYIKNLWPSWCLTYRMILGSLFCYLLLLLVGSLFWIGYALCTSDVVLGVSSILHSIISFFYIIAGSVLCLWLFPLILSFLFGLVDTDLSIMQVFKEAWKMTRGRLLSALLLLFIVIGCLIVVMMAEDLVADVIYDFGGLTYSFVFKIFFEKIIIMPCTTFIFFDFYRTLQRNSIMNNH